MRWTNAGKLGSSHLSELPAVLVFLDGITGLVISLLPVEEKQKNMFSVCESWPTCMIQENGKRCLGVQLQFATVQSSARESRSWRQDHILLECSWQLGMCPGHPLQKRRVMSK
jgi:hypothetical protein